MCNSCRLINHNSQHARLASTAQLHFHHLQPAGSGDALRNLAHPLGLKCHVTSNLQYALVVKPAETKKWACAHWCVSPILVLHNSFQILIYAARNEKTNDQRHPVTSSCLCK